MRQLQIPSFLKQCMLAMLFACVLTAADLAREPGRRLSLNMYLDLVTVSDPQISPDSKQIVFTRRWVDKMNDRYESALYVMNSDGSRQRLLVKGTGARWSPDGTRIAYLAEGEPKGNQIYVRWMDAEGGTTQITRLEEPPSGLAWSPDSKSIAFLKLVPQRETWNIKLPPRPEGAKWTADPAIVERLRYRVDRQGMLPNGFRHIFVVEAEGGAPRQLTSGNFSDSGGGFGGDGLSWTPDAKEIVFSALRIEDADYHPKETYVYAVDTASGAVRQLTRRKGENQNPVVSPNGKYVAYTGYDWVMQAWKDSNLYVMNIDGSSPRVLTPGLDRTPQGLIWNADSSGIYFGVSETGTRNLYYATLAGEVRPVTRGNNMLAVSSTSRNGVAAGTITNAYKPADVVAFDLARPQPKQLTAVNDELLRGVKLGEVEEFTYPSDNFKIEGWIVKPPDFDPHRKYPMILSIHGGPAGMYDVGFKFDFQEHAANDYVVVYTNPRGSTGYGTEFGNAINYDYPGKDYNDLMKGVDEVIARGYVDARNLFVYGCSGGGVLTSWIVGHTDRFAAASANCPVTDWLSFAGIVDMQPNYYYLFFNKFPWEDPSEYLKHSSVMYAGNVKTPTMLMTGVLDMRTPMPQTEEFYEALKLRNVPTAMVRFNGEYHGTTSIPSNFMRTQLYLRYWFEKYRRK